MLLSRAAGALALCALVAGPAAAAPATATAASFRARGRTQALLIDDEHVAVRHAALRPRPAFLRAEGAQAFAQLGVDLVARAQMRPSDAVVGDPVWFGADRGAVGILTDEIVVRVAEPSAIKLVKRLKGFAAAQETSFKKGLFLVRFASPHAALRAANALGGKQNIVYAHPNFLLPKVFRGGPADEPLFAKQWHLENLGQLGGTGGADIHARGAWQLTAGAPETIVAVLDAGFELSHPDLEGLWTHNSQEIPGNGVDDDGNGYVDDVSGWNFWAGNGDTSQGLLVDHGTAVAGLVGARRNGRGVTGVCPDCAVLPVVVAWHAADDAAAFYYAAKMGAAVISNSWGYAVGTPETDVLVEAIDTVAATGRNGKGTVILFAMNNFEQDDCVGPTPDISALPAVIAVSAASDQDRKVAFSAYGPCMEVLSPSLETDRAGIATTDLMGSSGYNNTGGKQGDLPDLDYTTKFGGTSAATPIAAGVFALMLTVNDDLTRDEALALVEATADKIAPDAANYDPQTGFSATYGYGRINAERAVRAAAAFKKYARREHPAASRL